MERGVSGFGDLMGGIRNDKRIRFGAKRGPVCSEIRGFQVNERSGVLLTKIGFELGFV